MSVDVKLQDGNGVNPDAKTSLDGELCVINAPYPPFEPQKVRPFRQYFTTDGSADGSNDMGVDGSVTNADFYIKAHETFDRYITTVNILMGYGATSKPYLFADVAARANGCRFFYNSERGEVNIHEGIKTNQDFFRLSFNQLNTSWEIRHLDANNDYGYVLTMDLTKLGLPFGIKLDAGTTQTLTMRIQDDCTDADSFNVIGYGFERFK